MYKINKRHQFEQLSRNMRCYLFSYMQIYYYLELLGMFKFLFITDKTSSKMLNK